ncbi:hypothetical protein IDAT_03545 [Pseudidiomarina atlantica]|uniref:Uncharacterized protein n=1 Tax=Pseudidiomarina atlantica TaxID=1517416 RepID=A0A094JA37_9GAMM|nr:hypothetical protein [Pseudidiomarina atlantica]KFZ29436.1 hypothetical protein IDAT_03545 [Pseudidiomarina atlantica]
MLKPDGRLLMIDPGSEHLAELKHVIYDEVHNKPERLPVAADQWRLASEQRLTYTFDLPSHQAIQALLLMIIRYQRLANRQQLFLLLSNCFQFRKSCLNYPISAI